MAKFLAITSRGLQDLLLEELQSLQYKQIKKKSGGVEFESNWEGCYRANYRLSVATRVLKPLLDFPAYNNEELYINIFKKHDFTKYIKPDQTLSVEASVAQSSFHDQRFVALKVKDAIVDQFRKKFGYRPDVNKHNPHMKIYVKVYKNQVSLSLDTSGSPLSHRGYRRISVEAPLREHVGAALVKWTGWKPGDLLVDPMCGSGTFLIEAARTLRGVAVGNLRSEFGFEKLQNFNAEAWTRVKNEKWSPQLLKNTSEVDIDKKRLIGLDATQQCIDASLKNSQAAGVDQLIDWRHRAFQGLSGIKAFEDQKGILIINPPYAERIGEVDQTLKLYSKMGEILRKNFSGWSCWILSGNEDLTAQLKLKAERKIPVFNGPIECRFLNYPIR